MTQVKKTAKMRREHKKLSKTVNTLASIIDTIATSMKGDIDSGEVCDIKQLKELTGAAKELSALISALDQGNDQRENATTLTVLFEDETQKWAQ